MSDVSHPRILTDPETARYIGMSGSWLRQARMNGNPDAPPYIKIGRSVRYLREDLDIWLEQRRRVSTSDPGPALGNTALMSPRKLAKTINANHGRGSSGPRPPELSQPSQTVTAK